MPEQMTASKHAPAGHAIAANRRRRETVLKLEARLLALAGLPQPISIVQVANRLSVPKGSAGRELTRYSLVPWFRVETLPGGRYLISVDLGVKNLLGSYQQGTTNESPVDFHKRLQRELTARRKEVEVKSHGSWVPDQIPKMGLIRILNWVDSELTAFRNGHSVNVREGAETTPQCGQEEHRGQET